MKRTLILATLLCLLATPAFAAPGSVVQSLWLSRDESVGILTLTWTAGDGADAGTIPATALSTAITAKLKGMFIWRVATAPGGTAPDDLYDLVLNGSSGADLMGSALLDRSTTLTEYAMPLIGGTPAPCVFDGELTLVITNNAVASSTGVIKIFLVR
jgi:hypothetical protein